MEKEMEKEKNIIMEIYYLKVNICIIIEEKENIILIID